MKRKFLFSFYETPQGKLLQIVENNYLKRSMTMSCKQTILQIGGLGWESDFIECSLYQKFHILDGHAGGCKDAVKIYGMSYSLPIQSETIDMVILPHLLEFGLHRFYTMREIERVLKPEGEVIILNFNPWSIWVRYLLLWNKKMSDTWSGHFISRRRIADWLEILDFEIQTTAEFTLDSIHTFPKRFKRGKRTFLSMAYAVRAVKRRYTLIPLTPVKLKPPRLASASAGLKSSSQRTRKHD